MHNGNNNNRGGGNHNGGGKNGGNRGGGNHNGGGNNGGGSSGGRGGGSSKKKPSLDTDYNKLKVKFGGKPICFKWNNRSEGCMQGDCGMAHVCQYCLSSDHPRFQCPKSKKARNM